MVRAGNAKTTRSGASRPYSLCGPWQGEPHRLFPRYACRGLVGRGTQSVYSSSRRNHRSRHWGLHICADERCPLGSNRGGRRILRARVDDRRAKCAKNSFLAPRAQTSSRFCRKNGSSLSEGASLECLGSPLSSHDTSRSHVRQDRSSEAEERLKWWRSACSRDLRGDKPV